MHLDFVSNEEIIQVARKRLEQGAWDYLAGGSASETTLRRNRLAFDRIAFRPRILVDVQEIDPSTTFMGTKLRIPAILAPMTSSNASIAISTGANSLDGLNPHATRRFEKP